MKAHRTWIVPDVVTRFRERKIQTVNVGLCDAVRPEKYRTRKKPVLLEVDPRQTEREYLLTTIHEWAHAVLPTLSEENIVRLEKSLGKLLWRLGYRCPGRGSAAGPKLKRREVTRRKIELSKRLTGYKLLLARLTAEPRIR